MSEDVAIDIQDSGGGESDGSHPSEKEQLENVEIGNSSREKSATVEICGDKVIVISSPKGSDCTVIETDDAVEPSQCQKCLDWQPPDDNFIVMWMREAKIPGIKDAFRRNAHIIWRVFCLVGVVGCAILGGWLSNITVTGYMDHRIERRASSTDISVEDLIAPSIYVTTLNSYTKTGLDGAFELYGSSKSKNYQALTGWSENLATRLMYIVDQVCGTLASFSSHFLKPDIRTSTSLTTYTDRVEAKNLTIYDDPGVKENRKMLAPFIKKGMTNCDNLASQCLLVNNKTDCKKIILATMTNMGVACVFNKMPEKSRRRHKTISNLLGTEHEGKATAIWKDWDFSQTNFPEQRNQLLIKHNATKLDSNFKSNEIPRSWKGAGVQSGLSMVLNYNREEYACPQFDSEGFKVLVEAPNTEPDLKEFGIVIPPFYEAFLGVYPTVIIADESIRKIDKKIRACYFNGEQPLQLFYEYTQSNCRVECKVKRYIHKCKCALLGQPKFPGTSLCNPSEVKCIEEEKNRILELGIDNVCSECKPGCSEVQYRTELTLSPFRSGNFPNFPNSDGKTRSKDEVFSIIHLFWGTDTAPVFTLKETTSLPEVVGNVGGIIGLTNGLTCIDLYRIPKSFITVLIATLAIWQRKKRQEELSKEKKSKALRNWMKLKKKVQQKSWRFCKRRPSRIPLPIGGFMGLPVIMVQPGVEPRPPQDEIAMMERPRNRQAWSKSAPVEHTNKCGLLRRSAPVGKRIPIEFRPGRVKPKEPSAPIKQPELRRKMLDERIKSAPIQGETSGAHKPVRIVKSAHGIVCLSLPKEIEVVGAINPTKLEEFVIVQAPPMPPVEVIPAVESPPIPLRQGGLKRRGAIRKR